jgi:hypothetical protein
MGGATKRVACAALVMLTMVVAAMDAAAAPHPPRDRPIYLVDETAVYDTATGVVDFTAEFDRVPNFRKVDAAGRRANSFQYFIVGDDTLPYTESFDAIIRGDELVLRSGLLPIRNSAPLDPDPAAGGWGTIRATVPFRLDGRVLTFSAPLTALSDHSTDGRFAYILETYTFGALVDRSVNQAYRSRRRNSATASAHTATT